MTEEQFERFLRTFKYSEERIRSICEEASTLVLRSIWKSQGASLSMEEAEEKAKEVRKQFSISVSLIESGIATPEDVIDDLE